MSSTFWIVAIFVLFFGVVGLGLIISCQSDNTSLIQRYDSTSSAFLVAWWGLVLATLFIVAQHVCQQWYHLLFLIFILLLMVLWLGFECGDSDTDKTPPAGLGVRLAVVIILLLMILTWCCRKIEIWTVGLVLIALWVAISVWSQRTQGDK